MNKKVDCIYYYRDRPTNKDSNPYQLFVLSPVRKLYNINKHVIFFVSCGGISGKQHPPLSQFEENGGGEGGKQAVAR